VLRRKTLLRNVGRIKVIKKLWLVGSCIASKFGTLDIDLMKKTSIHWMVQGPKLGHLGMAIARPRGAKSLRKQDQSVSLKLDMN